MNQIIEKYLTILLNLFEQDLVIMSQTWMYYTVVPIIGYRIFFFFKWAVLTTPVWMPFSIVAGTLRTRKKS